MMNAFSSIIGLIVAIICAIVCRNIAAGKGRGPTLWAILGFLFSIIALIVILILPRKSAI
jgi:hypothetical protein